MDLILLKLNSNCTEPCVKKNCILTDVLQVKLCPSNLVCTTFIVSFIVNQYLNANKQEINKMVEIEEVSSMMNYIIKGLNYYCTNIKEYIAVYHVGHTKHACAMIY